VMFITQRTANFRSVHWCAVAIAIGKYAA